MVNETESNEFNTKIFAYIALLEKTNDELLNTVKHCVRLMGQFTEMVPDPEGWQKMLNVFQDTIELSERVIVEKYVH